jgi:hypothetical protein
MKTIVLEENKSFKINVKGYKKYKVHIDYILDSKIYNDEVLIVYRIWLKHKKYFHTDIISFYELNLYNKEEITLIFNRP